MSEVIFRVVSQEDGKFTVEINNNGLSEEQLPLAQYTILVSSLSSLIEHLHSKAITVNNGEPLTEEQAQTQLFPTINKLVDSAITASLSALSGNDCGCDNSCGCSSGCGCSGE